MEGKTQTQKPKKKPRGRMFVKGGKPGPGRGHKSDPVEKPVGSDLSQDMRLAYTTVKTPGESPGVTEARKLLKKDYGRFMALYARLGATSDATADDGTPIPGEVGPKEEKVEGLIDQLLADWHREEGKCGPV